MHRLTAILLFILALATPAFPQCEIPKSQFEQAPNIFTPEQEGYFGDLIAEQMSLSLHPIDDASLNAYLNGIAQRLLKNAPTSPYNFRLQLIDQPYTNAFGIPGGRIYVTRKAALLAKDEDELAGLIAHELSHIYTRQLGADVTRMFRDGLGVTQVGDRADITRKYHQFLDTWRRKKFTRQRNHGEQEQLVADQTALYLMALAGYRPSAFGDYFDRLAETKGKTGGFWSDLFGTTTTDNKRLRAILDNVSSLPASCVSKTRPPEQEFTQWKQSLLEWSTPNRKDDVRDVVLRTKLDPPLLSDIGRLRFSPDGKYILAQDDSSVSVLTREPFAFLFRVTLPNHPLGSMFSPDSKLLITGSESGRVEKWDLISFKRVSVAELSMAKQCLQTTLSPDGNALACYRFDSLQLFDVNSSSIIFEKKNFHTPNFFDIFRLELAAITGAHPQIVSLEFSPDAHYFAAGSTDNVVAIDMTTRQQVPMHMGAKDEMRNWFVFAGNGRIFTRRNNDDDARLLEFPSCKLVSKFRVGMGYPRAMTKGDIVVVSPTKQYAAVIYEPALGKYTRGMPSAAFDMYGQQYVKENRNGDLLLAETDSTKWTTNPHHVQLPAPQLGNVNIVSVSDDLHWLAISETTRGGVFDLQSGARKGHYREFNGAWFSPDQQIWADFPKYEEAERTLARIDFQHDVSANVRTIDKDTVGYQDRQYFVVTRDTHHGATIEVHDLKSDNILWSREVKDDPRYSLDPLAGTFVLRWPASSQAAKDASHSDPALTAKLNQLKDRDKSYYVEVLEAETGKYIGHLLIDTGKFSFHIEDMQATRDHVAFEDNEGRARLYPLAGDDQATVMFAETYDLSKAGMFAVQSDDHHLQILDAKTMDPIDEYGFESPIVIARFVGDGTRILVLTRDQTAFIMKPQAHKDDTIQAEAK